MLPVVNVKIHRLIVRPQQNLIKPLEILIQPLNEMIKTRLFIQLAWSIEMWIDSIEVKIFAHSIRQDSPIAGIIAYK